MSAVWQLVMDEMNLATQTLKYCNQRIYPVRLPQRARLPSITYQEITLVREHAMGTDPGDVHARIQLDIYDKTYHGTASGSERVRSVLSRTSGLTSTGGGRVFDVFVDDERVSFVNQLEGVEAGPMWRRTIDLMVHYNEG